MHIITDEALRRMTIDSSQPHLLTDEAVERVAFLSRLEITPLEVKQSAEELSEIFQHINRLQSVSTEGVLPLDHPTELTDHIRDDIETKPLSQEQVLKNAPATQDVYFDVPKVIGAES